MNMDLEDIMVSGVSQSQKAKFPLHEVSEVFKLIEKESRRIVDRDLRGRKGELLFN